MIKIATLTKILSVGLGIILITMSLAQFLDMPGFAEALGEYYMFATNTELIAVVFMVLSFIAGVGMFAGASSVKVFSSAANIALVVLAGWFLAGILVLGRGEEVANWAVFGVYLAWPVSILSMIILLILGMIALFLALQGLYLKQRRGFF